MTNNRPVVVLTGGPGGGKSTLIEDLGQDPMWAGRFRVAGSGSVRAVRQHFAQ